MHREIITLSQGTDSVSTYFSKLKGLWNEYDAVVPSPSCECPRSKDYVDHLHQLRLIQFLSGLNDSYDQARRQILLKSTSPSINQAYAMIIEDEIQHSACMNTVSEKIDPVVMQASRSQSYNQGNNQGSQNFKGRRFFLQCEYCQYTGHTRDNCYKLIGYPSDWKHKKKSEHGNGSIRGGRTPIYEKNGGYTGQGINSQQSFSTANNVSGNHEDTGQIAASSHEVNNACVAKAHGFTEDEYKQILRMLNKGTQETHSNMTGMATCLMSKLFSAE